MLQLCQIYACANGTLGLNLSRAPWDPYPWVSGVTQDSNAQRAGIHVGDTVLELNGCDVLGMKISELALHLREHWQSGAELVSMVVWRNRAEPSDESSSSSSSASASSSTSEVGAYEAADGINQQSLQKFATCLQHIAQLLECPVCLEVIKPPGWQCCNGHVLCNTCRSRSEKCPVCRVPLGPRGRCLLSDKLFTLLAESFPCDGVKTSNSTKNNNSSNNNNNNSNNKNNNNMNKRCANPSELSKCTTEYHNHPKMAFAGTKLVEAKEMLKKTKYARQAIKLDAVTVVDAEKVSSESKAQIPKGNERQQTAGGQQQTNDNSGGVGLTKGQANSQIQREVGKSNFLNSAQMSDCNKQTSAATASGSNRSNNNNNNDKNEENDNLLVKPKLKSSKKSSQITGQDQDELHDDEVANINNGMPTTGVATATTTVAVAEAAIVLQQGQRQQQQQQQYQNYHCPTGKSCCSYVKSFLDFGQRGVDGIGVANKFSTSIEEAASATTTKTTTIVEEVDNNIAEEQQQTVYVVGVAKSSVSLAKSTNDVSLSCMTQSWRPRNRCETAGRCCCRGMQPGRHNCSCCDANKATAIEAPAEYQQQQEQQQEREQQQHRKLIVLTAKGVQAEQSIKAHNKSPARPPTSQEFGYHDEWQLLQHLSVTHRLAVLHHYGTYGERLHVPCRMPARHGTIACLNLRRSDADAHAHTVGQAQRFFLAVIALSDGDTFGVDDAGSTKKCAIFLWQITDANANEGSQYETIIVSQRTGIKWFGCAQPLTKSWHEIRTAGHFLTHPTMATTESAATHDAFEIVVKMRKHRS